MALVIDLKPSEKIIIGDALITNDKSRTRLHIEGASPILREKDILKLEDADTPCKKLYVFIQTMYLSHTPEDLYEDYFALVKEIQDAVPSTAIFFMQINDFMHDDKYYRALKKASELMDHEQELLSNV